MVSERRCMDVETTSKRADWNVNRSAWNKLKGFLLYAISIGCKEEQGAPIEVLVWTIFISTELMHATWLV